MWGRKTAYPSISTWRLRCSFKGMCGDRAFFAAVLPCLKRRSKWTIIGNYRFYAAITAKNSGKWFWCITFPAVPIHFFREHVFLWERREFNDNYTCPEKITSGKATSGKCLLGLWMCQLTEHLRDTKLYFFTKSYYLYIIFSLHILRIKNDQAIFLISNFDTHLKIMCSRSMVLIGWWIHFFSKSILWMMVLSSVKTLCY